MEIEQRIGRLHRLGQRHPVRIYNLVQRGTLQEHLLQILQEKLNLFELVVGETGLIQTGSRIEYQTLLNLGPNADASAVAESLRELLSDPVINVTSHEEATAAISGAYSRVTRYMGAISLISL